MCFDNSIVFDAGYLRGSLDQENYPVCTDGVLILSWSVMEAILGSP